MSDLTDKLRGKFIVLDGPDGAGKTTQLQLLSKSLEDQGLTVCLVRDPGGTAVGDKIREILLSPESGQIDTACEMMLFMASRLQLVAERIEPAREAGEVVLCDRFVSATAAYQGASGMDIQGIIKTWQRAPGGNVWPDLTVILSLPADMGLERVDSREEGPDAFVGLSGHFGPRGPFDRRDRVERRTDLYHQRVRELFDALTRGHIYPARVAQVQADQEIAAVAADVWAALEKAFA